MASILGHLERTATEPRDKLTHSPSLHTVILQHIQEVNATTRIFRLAIPPGSPPIRFLPGQWLDVYVPGISKAGGFTITSTPRDARRAYYEDLKSEAHGDGKEGEKVTGDDDDDDDDAGNSIVTNNNDNDNKEKGKGKGKGKKSTKGSYIELAIQNSPSNPTAAWLWRDPSITSTTTTTATRSVSDPSSSGTDTNTDILGSPLHIRVGGSFVWPPPGINVWALRRVVFVAGGVGVNPLVSMLGSLAYTSPPSTSTSSTSPTASASVVSGSSSGGTGFEVRFLYSLKDPLLMGDGEGERERDADKMLFIQRIARLFRTGRVKGRLEVFLTGGGGENNNKDTEGGVISVRDRDEEEQEGRTEKEEEEERFIIPFKARRCTIQDDILDAVGQTPAERRFSVVYVCGVPSMTDEFVAKLTGRGEEAGGGGLGMEPHRVLCEKWW